MLGVQAACDFIQSPPPPFKNSFKDRVAQSNLRETPRDEAPQTTHRDVCNVLDSQHPQGPLFFGGGEDSAWKMTIDT